MWEFIVPIILCLIAGIGLIVAEVFLPGFGLPGISGIILLIASVALAWVNLGPVAGVGMLVICLAVVAIAISLALRSATKGRLSKSPIILKDTESPEEGYSAGGEMDVFLGREGVTTTVLRPTGMGEFDGVRLNIMTDGEYVPANTPVRIEKVDGSRIIVKTMEG